MAIAVTEGFDVWTSALVSKSGAGRGGNSKREPYGINRLRELILDLAVRGKLVPQNPKDEPIAALIQELADGKTRLVDAGKIRAEKPLPAIAKTHWPHALPEGWMFVRLGDIAFSQAGFAFESKFFSENAQGLPLIRIRDVGQPFSGTFYSGEYRHEFLVESDDYLVTMDGDFRVAAWSNGPALLNQRVSRLAFFYDDIGKRFVADSLQARLRELQGVKAYTTVDHLSGRQISEAVIGLPPLDEQLRIIAKVEELMKLCDQCEQAQINGTAIHETLVDTLLDRLACATSHEVLRDAWSDVARHFDMIFTTDHSVACLKETILQLAIMGRLVPQDPLDEAATVLLSQIAATRKTPQGNMRAGGKVPVVGDVQDEAPFSLPVGWAWARFEELIDPEYPISYGVLVPGPDVEGGVPFVRIEDLDIYNPPHEPGKRIAEDIDKNYVRTRLRGGEILMGVVGSIGKLGIAPHSWAGANIARAICRIVPSAVMNRDFVVWMLQSKFMRGTFVGDTRTLAQPTLNIGAIRAALTPLPPIAEQLRIVSKLKELFGLCDALQRHLGNAATTRIYLADAAFERAVA